MKDIWNGDYSYSSYQQLLDFLTETFQFNYLVLEIPQILSQIHSSKIIIRHDILYSLEKALRMAEIENKNSIRATYAIDVDSPHFNIQDPESISTLNQIKDLGHEICVYLRAENQATLPVIESKVRLSTFTLQNLVGFPILSVAFPFTIKQVISDSLFICRKVNASTLPMWEWHLSDLKMPWAKEDLLPEKDNPKRALLQLLIHPRLWGDS